MWMVARPCRVAKVPLPNRPAEPLSAECTPCERIAPVQEIDRTDACVGFAAAMCTADAMSNAVEAACGPALCAGGICLSTACRNAGLRVQLREHVHVRLQWDGVRPSTVCVMRLRPVCMCNRAMPSGMVMEVWMFGCCSGEGNG